MKLPVYFDGVFISTKSSSSVDGNGRQVFKDYIALECNGEVGNILCTAQVKNSLAEIPKFSEIKFTATIDTWQKELVVNSIKMA